MKALEFWKPNTFKITSYKYTLKGRINKTHKTCGTDNTGVCKYTYNELGFRGDSIHKKGFKIMSIGCSLTEGVGVNNNETWPAQFCSHIPNSVNLNFGVSGRSNDYISRCLISYCDEIKPDLVLILYTFNHRREIYTESEQIEPYIPGQSWGYLEETEDGRIIQKTKDELQNDNEDFINWYKNHLLITNYLENKKIPFIWNSMDTDYIDDNKFIIPYTPFIDYGADGSHPGKLHNNQYSNKLFDWTSTKYPNIFTLNKYENKLL
jgi:lysophospholipase L1-like esterase